MATVNNSTDFFDQNSVDAMNLQVLFAQIEKQKKDGGDPQALLLSMSKALEEVLDTVNSGSNTPKDKKTATEDKIVTPNFKGSSQTQGSSNSQSPSASTMQEELGKLMGLLAQLEGEIAKWGNEKSNINSQVGTSLLTEMQSQVNAAQKQLQKVLDSENSPWGWLIKVFECIAAAIICTIAILCGQPELAAIVLVLTVLAVSGAMDKIQEGISSLLQAMGIPKNVADLVAAALIIVATIAITIMTCGAGAGAVAEEVADEATEMVEVGVQNATENATEETATETTNTVTEDSQSFMQKVKDFFENVGNKIKENNPFNKLPKNVNLGITAGSMAVGDTNFGQDLAVVILSKMKDGKEKDELEEIIATIVDLMAALAGAGAGMAASATSVANEASTAANSLLKTLQINMATAMKALQVGLLGAGIGEAGSQVGQGVVQTNLADATLALGEDQASISVSQALINMNNAQMAADIKTLKGQLQAHSQELATLGADLVKEGQTVAQVLQA